MLTPASTPMLTHLIARNLALLDQASAVVLPLSAAQYAAPPAGYHSSIGQHIRHILDHYRAILAAKHGLLDYALRERNTAVELDPVQALIAIDAIALALPSLKEQALLLQLEGACPPQAPHDTAQAAPSSMARELMFVLSHTVHHFAILGIYLRALGQIAPADFGVAPSTLAYRQQLVVAQVAPPSALSSQPRAICAT